ncbi:MULTISPECIES: hypothetical protein [Clostridium]|jgi:hypothetical protein|uniref:hypothetical protein n=1 Tax=Clostridium TaxID=1485 RepID=UPI000287D3E0|nr:MULTISPECIES: hypothetical protein [Clostridium]MDF2504661.1 hypothetical protein [Clostridium sp.]
MYPFTPNSYDKTSKYLFNLIGNINECIKFINGVVDELLMVDKFNKSADFLKFIIHFNQGSFSSFKCEGYMECLIASKFYAPSLLCYLLNEIDISLNHFNESLIYLEKVKTNYRTLNNEDFKKLLEEMDSFTSISKVIKDVADLYNIPF